MADKKEEQRRLLDSVAQGARFFNTLFPLDCLVAVTDGEKFLAVYVGETFDPGVKAGDPVAQDGIIPEVMRSGCVASAELSQEVYGVPLKTTTAPIKDEFGEVIGTIDVAFDLSTQNQLMSSAQKMAATAQEVSSSCEELSDAVGLLRGSQDTLRDIVDQSRTYLKKIEDILVIINKVASQTNLLGINAAIESARSGEAGRGFAVVAKSIQDLSDKTAASTREVSSTMDEIQYFFKEVDVHTEKTTQIGSDLFHAINGISQAMEENADVAETLLSLAKIL